MAKRDVQYFRIWQSKPIIEKLFMTSESGKLRRKCKHHLKQMAPFFEDCIEEAKRIMEELDIDGVSIPFEHKEFVHEFEEFLLSTDEMVSYEMYQFSEELMEFADGISGKEELSISWLFDENQPQPE